MKSEECRVKSEAHWTVGKPYPLSRTVSKSRTPCFRQFNNPGTFKMDVCLFSIRSPQTIQSYALAPYS